MRITRKGILPDSRPLWSRRIDALRRYINDLEMCLSAANRRVRKLAYENDLLRRSANCPYARPVPAAEAAKEEGGDE
jgi:hypothetical protein